MGPGSGPRRFPADCTSRRAGVSIDVAAYVKTQPFRTPNSKHQKTGRHKRRLTFEELMGLRLEKILALAADPAPFDVPNVTRTSDPAAADWKAAAEHVASCRTAGGSPAATAVARQFESDPRTENLNHGVAFPLSATVAVSEPAYRSPPQAAAHAF